MEIIRTMRDETAAFRSFASCDARGMPLSKTALTHSHVGCLVAFSCVLDGKPRPCYTLQKCAGRC